MTSELRNARLYLRTAQNILAHVRANQWANDRKLIAHAEARVLGALEWVWQAQCRAVFEDHDDGFFDTPKCAAFVNQVDWGASGEVPGLGLSVVVQKERIEA